MLGNYWFIVQNTFFNLTIFRLQVIHSRHDQTCILPNILWNLIIFIDLSEKSLNSEIRDELLDLLLNNGGFILIKSILREPGVTANVNFLNLGIVNHRDFAIKLMMSP